MVLYSSIEEVEKNSNTVLTVGTFDGLHNGHKKIIATVLEKAAARNARSMVVTFNPHPRVALGKDENLKLLHTLDEKIYMFSKTGIDALLVLPFNRAFASLSAEEFLRSYVVDRIGVSEMIAGHDHRFGKDRIGDEIKLQELSKTLGFTCSRLDAVLSENNFISSSRIRNVISSSDMETAKELLGYQYFFSSKIVEGNKRGRTIGYPTANAEINDPLKLIPPRGVYAVFAELEGVFYKSIINIGYRPTFDAGEKLSLETHLFDFSRDIYGAEIRVHFIRKIRDEKKFGGVAELIKQIDSDVLQAQHILEKININ